MALDASSLLDELSRADEPTLLGVPPAHRAKPGVQANTRKGISAAMPCGH
jgi:hypothetical protein